MNLPEDPQEPLRPYANPSRLFRLVVAADLLLERGAQQWVLANALPATPTVLQYLSVEERKC